MKEHILECMDMFGVSVTRWFCKMTTKHAALYISATVAQLSVYRTSNPKVGSLSQGEKYNIFFLRLEVKSTL